MKTIKLILAFLFSLTLAACGGGGGGGGGMSPPAANISGTWSMSDTSGANNCGDPTGVTTYWTGVVSHTAGSNSFTLTTTINGSNRSYTGTISGSTITISGSYPDVGGTTTTSFSGTLISTANPMTFSGTSSWSWTNGATTCSGTAATTGTLTAYAGGTTTITTMPYSGSVTGTNDGFYLYTTVGTVDTISASGLTADIDPNVYTDSTFTTLDTNWACTNNAGTTADSCTATTPVTAGTPLYIKVRNFAAVSSTFTLSVSGPAGVSTATIASMPYNGSVTGVNDGFYQYTTVGSVDTISLSGMTSDLDPKVYTSSAFTTLDTNWACTINVGTTADSCTATTPVAAGTLLYIKVRNFAGVSSPFTLSVSGPVVGGTSVTTTFGNITGLSYNAGISSITATQQSLVWTNSALDMFQLVYQIGASEDVLSLAVFIGGSGYWAGTPTINIICHVSGTNTGFPTCASWGITVSRAAGTISFASTPAFDMTTNATGTMSGSFTFTPF